MRKLNKRPAKDRPQAKSTLATRPATATMFSTFEVLESRTFLSAAPFSDHDIWGPLNPVVAQVAPAASTPAPATPSLDAAASASLPPAVGLLPVTGTIWTNSALPAQTGTFQLDFDAVASQANGDTVVGISNGAASSYKSLAAIVRFNNAGQIDVRNGSGYGQDAALNYTAGVSYHIRMVVATQQGTYSVYVTPAGGAETLIARNYSFRTEQASTQSLNNLGAVNTTGAVTLSNVVVSSAGAVASTPATPVGLAATATSSSQINLSWTAPSDGSAVSLLRSTNGINFTVLPALPAGSNRYVDTGLSASTQYFYEILATNSVGDSSPTAAVTATTLAAPVVPPVTTLPTIGAAWTNIPLSTQKSAFQLNFDASPAQQGVDTVIGVAGSTVNSYQQLSAIIRFNVNNQIDARNAGGYTADAAVPYTAGVSYHFRFVIDPTQQVYSVYVTPQGGSEVLLASNYAFRSEQSALSTISSLAGYSTVGSATVSNVSVTALASAPASPNGLTATTASTSQINLAWSNAAGSTSTTILRSTNGQNFSVLKTLGAGVTSYSDTGLTSNATYYYEIYNSNATGDSATTAAASATTSAVAPPVTPPPPVIVPPPVTPPTTGNVKPDATNTGPTNASILTPSGSITVTVAGTVIQNVSVTGTIVIKAANVTIKNFKIDAAGGTYGVQVVSGSVTLQDGEIINAMGGAVFGNNWTALRLNVHQMGSDAFDGGGNNTLQDCYIHDIGMSPGAHADGIQLNNGDHIVIEGNNFDTPWWNQVGSQVYRTNSCIFLNGYVYNYLDGTVIDGNWFNGGNYSIYALGQTNTVVSNNVFGEDYQYGDVTGNVATWTGNTDALTGKPV